MNAVVFGQQRSLNLSPSARTAVNNLARETLLNGPSSKITSLKPQLDPQDYATVKNIGLLPDNPLYLFKSIGRGLRLFFTFGESGKNYQLLKDGNEKTLEALLITEKAANQKDAVIQDQLVNVAANTLDSVGSDFDSVAKTLDSYIKTDSIGAYLLQQEAFQFAGYYLKHQILLQKQQERLSEKDFLLLEKVRIKHLNSIAHIVVLESRDPVIFGQQLSQLLSSEVGSNNTQLAAIAVLRDLENNANPGEVDHLQNAQEILQKELEIKLNSLPKAERLKQIENYIAFVHGNPIRDFQAYNFLSKSFTSQEMNLLTQGLKDKAAQDFKKHLSNLDSTELQNQFVQTVFSKYPIDMRLLFYTQIQLTNDKATAQLARLEEVKSILKTQVCQTYGADPEVLTNTRFYEEATVVPSVLDIRVGQFLNQSLQDCNGKTPQALRAISDLQVKINNAFTAEAKNSSFIKLPTKAQAKKILKEENIAVSSQDEQKVAEKIEEETSQIEEEISENPTVLEKEVLTIVEKISTEPKTIVEEIIQSGEPTVGEITAKEEQIIEEIVDAAEIGETSPLVEELPREVQEEIAKETKIPLPTNTPIPSPTFVPTIVPTIIKTVTQAPTVVPTLIPTATIVPLVTSVPTTAIQAATPTPIPVEVAPGL